MMQNMLILYIKHGNTLITCQKEEKECIWDNYLIYAVLSQFQNCRHLRFSPRQICIPKILELTQCSIVQCSVVQCSIKYKVQCSALRPLRPEGIEATRD